MDVCLIQVPFMAGNGAHAVAKAPEHYLRGGVEQLMKSTGVGVTRQRVEVPSGTAIDGDLPAAFQAVGLQLQRLVRAAVAAGQLPVVLAGSCDACLGVLCGMRRHRCGIVWIDAHADFNTPESSLSGFFPGMSLAIITGHCYQELWASIGDSTPVPEDAIVLIGVRSLSPLAEVRRLQSSAIRSVPWHQGRPVGDLESELDQLAERVDEVYLHIDNDAFDPQVAPGVVDEPVPGGLSLSDMERAVTAVAARLRIGAVTIATYTPDNDRDDQTLKADLRVLELIGQYAAARQ